MRQYDLATMPVKQVAKWVLAGGKQLSEVPAGRRKAVETAMKNLQKPAQPAVQLEVVHKGSGWYDVLDASGNPVNEKSLRKDDAEALARGE